MVLDVDAAQGVRTLAGHILHTHAKDGKIFKFMGGEEVYGIFCDGGIEELQKLGEYFRRCRWAKATSIGTRISRR